MRNLSFGVLSVFLFSFAAFGQEPPQNLILDAPGGKTLPRVMQRGGQTATGGQAIRGRLIRLNLDAIDPDAPGAQGRARRVRLHLFDDVQLDVVETRSRRRARRGGGFHWSGQPWNGDAGDVVLSVVEGRVSGSIALKQGFFQIRHVENDLHEVTEVSVGRDQLIDDAIRPMLAPQMAAKLGEEPPAAAAAGDPQIDVLVVYTPEARAQAGGSQQIQDRIDLAIAEANTSFVNSGVAASFNLIGVAEVATSTTQSATSGYLNQVTFFEPEIQALRDYYGADLVSVWIHNGTSNYIGIGWLNQTPANDFSQHAYSVVEVNHATGPSYTFSHEAGHNMGGAHDRAHAGSQGAYNYSYGYQYNPGSNGFYTIMSYSAGCGGCSPKNNWSNPNVLINGVPSGIPQGQIDSADNASTLNLLAPTTQTYRTAQPVAPNNSPTATDLNLNVTSSSATSITLAATDPDGNPLTYDVTKQPLHGTLSGSAPNLTYTSAFSYEGPDSFEFQVRDSYGGFDLGVVNLNVQLASSSPPNVSLAQPAGGPFTAPATVPLVATASDLGGSIDHVEFFADGHLLGSATSQTSSFAFDWTNAPSGTFQLTATAYDNLGVSATSSPVSVTIQPGATAGYTSRMVRLFYAFDENGGPTVFDKVGAHDAAVEGSATWTTLGLQGGWANAGQTSFLGNELSAVSGDDFTVIWTGRLGTGSQYQAFYSMAGPDGTNLLLRYYQPSGYIFLTINGVIASYYNAAPLFNEIVMITLRCSGGACSWRVGGSGPWLSANPGSSIAANPVLNVGSDLNHWNPQSNNTTAMFWVYGDALTDQEVDANFQYAGSTLQARAGQTLNGYTAVAPNAPPSVSLSQPAGAPFTAPASIALSASASDSDGSIARVDFYADGALLGSDSTGPAYTFNWSGVAEGSYSVFARAFDNLGASTDSAPVSVNVSAPSGGGGGGGGTGGYTTRAAALFYAFDENGGSTVFDKVGAHHASVGGNANWTTLGLQGGWANAGQTSFSGNELSAASGDAFTIIWTGRLSTGSQYQTLFSMAGQTGGSNVLLRYYQPSGYLYLSLSNAFAGYFNASSFLNQIVMITLRCSAGSCSWRVGQTGPWLSAAPGTGVASNPVLNVGADFNHWIPQINNTSALFWVYTDALTDQELDANFQYAGSVLQSRGGYALNGYTPGAANSPPAVSLAQPAGGPFTAPANIALSATASDADGSVARVDFYSNGALLGSDSTGPAYTFNWTGVAEGSYSVVARAYDNLGASTDSTPVSVNVSAPSSSGPDYTTRAALAFYAFDENGGATVFDQIGSRDATVGGSATWTNFGLQGGWASAGVQWFGSNTLSAAEGDSYTAIWVGRLDTSSGYQTLFSMQDANTSNIQYRYYQPSGALFLVLNNAFAGYTNVASLTGKNVMIVTRCSGGSCAWKVGAGPWMNANPGAGIATAPVLQIGGDFRHYAPMGNSASALFWVYGDALTDEEIDANLDYAGATLNSRGGFSLEGYTP